MRQFLAALAVTWLLSPLAVFAQQQCVSVDPSLTCSSLGKYTISDNYARDCGANLPAGASCCCSLQPEAATSWLSPKIILIFSLVAVFGILTIGILIFRKNDTA